MKDEEKKIHAVNYLVWGIILALIFILITAEPADASWTQTGDTFTDPTYEGIGSSEFECNGGSYSMPFDCASHPDIVETVCSVARSTNNMGIGAYVSGVSSNIDTQMFFYNMQYLDFACTGTTLTQFDVYDPVTPSWYSSGGTSTNATSSTEERLKEINQTILGIGLTFIALIVSAFAVLIISG